MELGVRVRELSGAWERRKCQAPSGCSAPNAHPNAAVTRSKCGVGRRAKMPPSLDDFPLPSSRTRTLPPTYQCHCSDYSVQ